jgi:hypothetical protein
VGALHLFEHRRVLVHSLYFFDGALFFNAIRRVLLVGFDTGALRPEENGVGVFVADPALFGGSEKFPLGTQRNILFVAQDSGED